MIKNSSKSTSEMLTKVVIEGLQEKKASNITILDLRKIHNAMADFFVICTGNSDTQVQALMDSVEEQVYNKLKQSPYMKEGYHKKEWVLLDYVDVVTHIFQKEKRKHYSLEELWGDAKIEHIAET